MKLHEIKDTKLPYEIDNNGNVIWTDEQTVDFTGCPSEVKGYFECTKSDKLVSLKGLPSKIKNLGISYAPLRSLEGCPEIEQRLFVRDTWITSLEGVPEGVSRIDAHGNRIDTLVGIPEGVSVINLAGNELTKIDYLPKYVKRAIDLEDNKISSLVGIHKFGLTMDMGGRIDLSGNPIEEGGIGLLLIDGLEEIKYAAWNFATDDDAIKAFEIIRKYLGKGRKALIDCQDELMDSGLERFAKL